MEFGVRNPLRLALPLILESSLLLSLVLPLSTFSALTWYPIPIQYRHNLNNWMNKKKKRDVVSQKKRYELLVLRVTGCWLAFANWKLYWCILYCIALFSRLNWFILEHLGIKGPIKQIFLKWPATLDRFDRVDQYPRLARRLLLGNAQQHKRRLSWTLPFYYGMAQ